MMVQQTIWFQLVCARGNCIMLKLLRENNLNISKDLDAIRLLLYMIVATSNSNELIAKDFLDMYRLKIEKSPAAT